MKKGRGIAAAWWNTVKPKKKGGFGERNPYVMWLPGEKYNVRCSPISFVDDVRALPGAEWSREWIKWTASAPQESDS